MAAENPFELFMSNFIFLTSNPGETVKSWKNSTDQN